MIYLKKSASLEFFPERCTGCGRCTEVCPHAVFAMNNKRAVLQDRDRCMECGACARNCDFNAIRVDNGVGCAAAIISGMLKGGEPSCDCSVPSDKGCC